MRLRSLAVGLSQFAMLAVVSIGASAVAAEPELIARWKLAGDEKDSSSQNWPTVNHGVQFDADGPDGSKNAARFTGRGAFLEAAVGKKLALGRDDFTISLKLHTAEVLDDDLGDLVTWYDPENRVGFNLSLRTNTGVTTCPSNSRQLQFGIDAGTTPQWHDVGRPGNATLAFALTVHDGALYAGTCSNGPGEVGRVYRYAGPGKWIDCGAPDKANAVSSLCAFQGALYAASSKYRFAGSALTESDNAHFGGGIYRYEGESKWTEVGRLPETEAVGGMVVYKGRLYASSLYRPAGFFRYERDGEWTRLPTPDEKRVESLGVYNGYLWATSYDGGRVYRFDGESWKDFGQLDDNTQTYSFAIHQGKLCVGTWRSGKVYQLEEPNSWRDLGQLGEEWEVMGMLVHNGKLYAGSLPLAEIYRYDGEQRWTKTGRIDETPDMKYRRAWTMAQHQGRLFCSALPTGHVHAMDAGVCVTHDRELPAGWRHVAAVKSGRRLRLYVDGERVAESTEFDPAAFDLNTEAPLRIGAGAGDTWNGILSDVRLYRGALDQEQIRKLGASNADE